VRVFLNAENVFDVRQTKWDPLVLPRGVQTGGGRSTPGAPLDGRVFNGGVRVGW